MNKIKKLVVQNLPYILLFCILFSLHLVLNVNTGDDIHFTLRSSEMSLLESAIEKYTNWSSRQFIEGILYFVAPHPIIWKILDSLVITIIAKLVYEIFCNKTIQFKWLSCLSVLVYPMIDMSSAGWMATTINYLWPLCAILGNLYFLKKVHLTNKLKIYEYVVSVVFLLFAANQEQGLAIMLGIYLMYTVYCIYNRKVIPKFIYINILCILLSGIYIFTCPGNWIRKTKEITSWFEDFGSLSLFKKIEIGVSATLYPIVFNYNPVSLFFTFSLVTITSKVKNSVINLCAMILTAVVCVFGLFGQWLISLYPNVSFLYTSLGKYGILSFNNYKSVIVYLIFFLVIVSLMVFLFQLVKKDKKNIDIFCILLVGFGSSVMMGFSPTVWASGSRTAIFFYFSLIISACILLSRYSYKIKNINTVLVVSSMFAILNMINCII